MKTIDQLVAIMGQLRDPESGCPWDRQQNFKTIAPYTIEEAYEVADAIQGGNFMELKEELGDLLFQVIYHSRMAEEQGLFNLEDVADILRKKLIARHPHIFANEVASSAKQQSMQWQQKKTRERIETGKGVLSGISAAMPALLSARKLQEQAASVGFDWSDVNSVVDKLQEELDELKREVNNRAGSEAIENELGDVLFSCVNIARHTGVDAESALRGTNQKFARRFSYIEEQLDKQGKAIDQTSLEEMDSLWEQAKQH